jgi:hypothetical protein
VATSSIYIGDSDQGDVWVLNLSGVETSKITTLHSSCCYLTTAADNSGGPSDGTIYVASSNAGGTVYKLDGAGNAVNFSSGEPWVSGNALTGTETGSLAIGGGPTGLAVDSAGNIYVTEEHAVNEFSSTGDYVGQISETPGGPFGRVTGVAIDPTSDNVLVLDAGHRTIEEFDSSGAFVDTTTSLETPTGEFSEEPRSVAVDSSGRAFVSDAGNHVIQVFSPNVVLPKVNYQAPTNATQTSGTLNAEIDPNEGGNVISCKLEYGPTSGYGSEKPCTPDPASAPPGSNFSVPTMVSAGISGLTTETTYNYRFVVANANGVKKGGNKTFVPHAVEGLSTDPATAVEPTSAKLNGSWTGNGEDTEYHFDWGTTPAYGQVTPTVDQGSAPGPTPVSFDLSGLTPITSYHFRIVATNNTGTSYGEDRSFTTPPNAPLVKTWVTDVHADTGVLNASINPGGGNTVYHFEIGPTVAYGTSLPAVEPSVGSGLEYVDVNTVARGLSAGTTYHYRIVATNAQDTVEGPDRTFTTFPFISLLEDSCPNALVRKQTSAALLPDCRAFELASAADQGGYDVESDLVPGQSPLAGYPAASGPSRVLYSVHFGAIPGTDHPTNLGLDPYVATRGEDGWTTEYVGVPANSAPGAEPFGSPLLGADATLTSFAFGGPTICDPCFSNGSTGIPIRVAGGALIQGMAGSLPVANPEPAGQIDRAFSADGSHFLFGSTQKFEPDGNSGEVSIYDRDLATGVTRVVSKTPGGATMTGAGIAELDVSDDGSRVLIGQLTGTDAEGNAYYHLYMNVGGSNSTIDLTPTASAGALYNGMSPDGSRVLLTTRDGLPGDGDTSADLYRADVGTANATLTRVSTGTEGTGDGNLCAPPGDWNTPAGGPNCDVVPVAGGGGVAGDGTAYFFSPEKLDGAANGTAGQPNMYVARPGSAPRFVATLEVGNPVISDGVSAAATRDTADFQVSRNGAFAVFHSELPLTGYDNNGHSEIYRYAAAGDELDCASCAPTGVRATGDATLARHGSSLTVDGRVFFTSLEPLAPRDLNGKLDAYEWEKGKVDLVSTGSSQFDSGLLSVSDDGVDAYIFTHEVLAPQDKNGTLMKVYDAREKGGFLYVSRPQPCQASDECHGRGSDVPPPPSIRTVTGTGTPPPPRTEAKRCKKGAVRKSGRCVRKKSKHHSKRKRQTSRSRRGTR